MLIGLGLGPGDPEMLTLRAVRLLREADKVFVPGGMALDLVKPYCRPETLDFPMSSDPDVLRRAWTSNAERIAESARGGNAVLGMIGDPSFYSTFSRQCEVLRELHPDIETAAEPGISSITSFASRAGLSVDGGFIVTDGRPVRAVIRLKASRPGEIMAQLKAEGYGDFVLARKVFQEGEAILRGDEIPETSDDFSIMYARK